MDSAFKQCVLCGYTNHLECHCFNDSVFPVFFLKSVELFMCGEEDCIQIDLVSLE